MTNINAQVASRYADLKFAPLARKPKTDQNAKRSTPARRKKRTIL